MMVTMVGETQQSNALLGAASPYLRQHAHNPVQWYPWGAEALRLAKKQQKPIFLSIGYSTCYWCHVMEREVFADKAMAEQMNTDFINVKVDREERPDLDEIYMLARQIITREGGWPNNVFLTPDLKPFFAGGTFARDQRYGQPSFTELLESMAHAWQHKRAEVEAMGMQVAERLTHTLSQGRTGTVQKEVLQASVEKLVHHLKVSHDDVHGGFYTAPKFPHETYLLFLADYYRFYKDKEARDMLVRSLDGMAAGGMYDHVGGGFHRYSVDARWQVPHFEKMLYNQALLTLCYLEGYALSGKPYYEDVVRKTLDFVAEHMVVSGGGFASAYDAETDAVEGAYYVWSEEELAALLPKRTKAFLDAAYLRVGLPEFPGHAHAQGGVLVARAPLDQIAAQRGMTYDAFQDALDKTLGKLLFRRSNRKTPARDDKVITAWNGMMITAYAQAGMVLEDRRYVAMAEKAAAFLLKVLRDKRGVVYRIYSKKQRQQRGFLEDYAWLVRGLTMLARVTGKENWLIAAIEVINMADDLLLDGRSGGFFFSEVGKDLLVQMKTADDGAVPAANAVMVQALADLADLTQQTRFAGSVWQERAENTIAAFAGQVVDNPAQYVHMLHGQMRFWQAGEKKAFKKKPVQAAVLPRAERRKTSRVKAPSKALDSAYYVQVSAELDKKKIAPTNTFRMKVTLKIAEGWHIQPQNAVRKGLIATQVDVRSAHTTVRKVAYPKAQHFVADMTAGTVDVYKDVITIPVTLYLKAAAQPGDIENVRIIVTFQACSETSCLQTATTVVEMPLIVGKR